MQDVLCKKGMGLAIICLFIGASVVPTISGGNSGLNEGKPYDNLISSELLVEDELDQYNHEDFNTAYIIFFEREDWYQWLAQSFKPTLPILTRIKLFLGQTSEAICDLIVSIREDMDGNDIVSVSISPEEIPEYPDHDWIEFDLLDISVDIGETYYIVARCNCNYYNFTYYWLSNVEDVYPNGEHWVNNSPDLWRPSVGDSCFETYGFGSGLEVEINSGFRISADIINNGIATASDIYWSIDLKGGLILAGEHTEGVISELGPGAAKTIRQSTLYGIGRTTITITVGDATKQATGFILGPLVLGVEEI